METLPTPFIEQMERLLPNGQLPLFLQSLTQEQPTSIRLNPSKAAEPTAVAAAFQAPAVPWCPEGRYIETRPAFTFDPLFHAGCYYVQEASSMFVWQAVRQFVHEPVTALDLCAAPGGKSTLLRSALPPGSVLVCNEYVPARAWVLAENMVKWGHPDVVVTRTAPANLGGAALEGSVDFLLADVPCSGEGMFRKDQEAVAQWSPALVRQCALLQRQILQDAWPALKAGGLLAYSTCTYNNRENEENVEWICRTLGAEMLEVVCPGHWGVTGNLMEGAIFPVCHFLPHRAKGEGFFLALLRKKDEAAPSGGHRRKAAKPTAPAPKDLLQTARQWIADPAQWEFSLNGTDLLRAERPAVARLRKQMEQSGVTILESGVTMAQSRGRDIAPAHQLSQSTALRHGAFPEVEVDYQQALAYLRREAIPLPAGTPRGYVLLLYRQQPLGFVKNVGNRANNLYPAEWRVKSSHTPGEPAVV